MIVIKITVLDNILINFLPTLDIIALHRQDFLQDIAGTVAFQGPDFHFAEALTPELSPAAQRLLGHQRIRTNTAGVNLVVRQVVKLHHVNIAAGGLYVKRITGYTVVKLNLAICRQVRFQKHFADLLFAGAVKNRGLHRKTEGFGRPTQMGFQNLAHVHPGGNA